jgi:GTP cyclohydrolase I
MINTVEETARALFEYLLHPSAMSAEAWVNTPRRYIEALQELMGMNEPEWSFTVFESNCDEMVIVKDIDFTSLCEHHMLPFIGHAHVAYIPDGQIAGLSKIARTVQQQSKGLWTQEHLTLAIATYLEERLRPLGIGVVLEATHTCMAIRGVKANGSSTTTSAMRGVFRDTSKGARAEFLGLIR